MLYTVPSRFDPEVSSYSIDTLDIGLTASDVRRVLHTDISKYVALSRDKNPIHSNTEYAKSTRFKQEIALGLLPEGILSSLLGTKLPGQGAIYVGKTVSFKAPVNAGDSLVTLIKIDAIDRKRRLVDLSGECKNGEDTVVAEYHVKLMLDRGQELEFLCDFYKFTAERSAISPDFLEQVYNIKNTSVDGAIQELAQICAKNQHKEFLEHLKIQLQQNPSEVLSQRLLPSRQMADRAQSLTANALLWWSSASMAFDILQDEQGLSAEEAMQKLLNWLANAPLENGMTISLSGLERLGEVNLPRRVIMFDLASTKDITQDITKALAKYVAHYVLREKKQNKPSA